METNDIDQDDSSETEKRYFLNNEWSVMLLLLRCLLKLLRSEREHWCCARRRCCRLFCPFSNKQTCYPFHGGREKEIFYGDFQRRKHHRVNSKIKTQKANGHPLLSSS
mmetsp:Transcript_58782/g.143785  ORF Transcript_58782/g.143785 Transcript_58782/m.143785 type:complete len:108 (-) Transcript_58782:18-341(-)